ncbi:MAG: hypothetical protein AAGB01_01380 [Cyanobacteria bacterium P01_F01_bin.42]
MSIPRSGLLTISGLCSAALLSLGRPALAQTGASDLQPWEGGGQTEEASSINDPLGGRNGTGSLFDLINRIQSLPGQSGAEFRRNQDKNFNSAVQDFQKKQQQVIESQPEE